jgi:hypothetical protein
MGHSHSKTNANITNNIVNSTDVALINKNVINSATETLIKNASSCSSAVHQSNSCSFKNNVFTGDTTIGSNQTNQAKVDFSCVQADSAASEMKNTMKNAIAGQLAAISEAEVAAKLNAAAQAANKSGFLSTGGGASSSVNSNVSTNITNQTKTTIENMYEQNLKNSFSSETVNECIGKTTQENETSFAGDEFLGAKTELSCIQSNTLEQVQECKQLSEAANTALIATATELGFKIETLDKAVVAAELEAISKASNESTGPLQDLTGLVNSFTGLLGLASLGVAAPFVIYSCCIFCCILLCCSSSMFIAKSGSDSGSGTGSVNKSSGKMIGGYSTTTQTSLSSDSPSSFVGLIGTSGLDILSDIFSDSTPL